MKNAQTIVYVFALAAVLAIYDMLKEWMNFSTIVALIVVLSLFSTWLIVQLILNKFVFNKSEIESSVTEPKPITKVDLSQAKRIFSQLKPRRMLQPKPGHAARTVAVHARRAEEKKPEVAAHEIQPEQGSARAKVQCIVTNLCTVPGITAAAIVSTDGVIFVSAPEGAISSYRAATATGSMFALGNRIVDEFGRDNLEQIMVRGEHGEVFFHRIAKEAFIMVLVNKDSQMGRVVRETKEAAENAAALMVE